MKSFHSVEIRNFSIIGYGLSGKVLLSEALPKINSEINRLERQKIIKNKAKKINE